MFHNLPSQLVCFILDFIFVDNPFRSRPIRGPGPPPIPPMVNSAKATLSRFVIIDHMIDMPILVLPIPWFVVPHFLSSERLETLLSPCFKAIRHFRGSVERVQGRLETVETKSIRFWETVTPIRGYKTSSIRSAVQTSKIRASMVRMSFSAGNSWTSWGSKGFHL